MYRIYFVAAVIFIGACAEQTSLPGSISPSAASNFIAQAKTVCGRVSSGGFFDKLPGKPTYINLGRPFPNQEFTILILGENIEPFDMPLVRLHEKNICVTGSIQDAGGVPLIEVISTEQLVEL